MPCVHRGRRAVGIVVVLVLSGCASPPAVVVATTTIAKPRPTGSVASFGGSTTTSTPPPPTFVPSTSVPSTSVPSTFVPSTSTSSSSTTTTAMVTPTTSPARTTVVPTTQAPVAHSVFMLGDSVMAGIGFSATAKNVLRGYAPFVLEAKECRRMNGPSCALNGSPPPSPGIAVLQGSVRRLGDTVVIMVGYNEIIGPRTIDLVMKIVGPGRRVLWLTYRNGGGQSFGASNGNLVAAARRWSNLRVADWNAYSAGRSGWFVDGLHLTSSGAPELARFIVSQLRQLDTSPPPSPPASGPPTRTTTATNAT